MDRIAFEAGLRRDGFAETVERSLPPGTEVPDHTHPFDARLLILSGTLDVTQRAARASYPAGTVVEVPRDLPHAEHAGPQGASYLAGRRR